MASPETCNVLSPSPGFTNLSGSPLSASPVSSSPASLCSSILDFRSNPFVFLSTEAFKSRAIKIRCTITYHLSGSSQKAQQVFEMTFGKGLTALPKFEIQTGEGPKISYNNGSNIVTILLAHNWVFEGKKVEGVDDDYHRDNQLGTNIYEACSKDSTIRKALNLTPLDELDELEELDTSNPFIGEVITRIVEVRKEALKLLASNLGSAVIVSSKEECMKFGDYGKMSLRVLPDGSTYVILPHIKPCYGGMKKVKYGVFISPDGERVSVQMICKLQNKKIKILGEDSTVREARSNLLKDSFEIALTLPDHPHVLLPTAMISHPKKGYEMIMPKSDTELFYFLEPWFHRYNDVKSHSFEVSLFTEESIPHVKTGMQFLLEITSGMKHLFDHKYLYRDLKTENVMVKSFPDGSMMSQIIDLDFLSPVDEKVKLVGTLGYLPVNTTHNTLATDLYALGRVIRYEKRKGVDSFSAPSFNDLFGALLGIESLRGNMALARRIKKLKDDLFYLSDDLINGRIDNYDEVLARLERMDLEFIASIGGRSTASTV